MKRKMFLILTWIFIVSISSNLLAQPVPEYEGVYLLTKSNELIELPQKNGIRAKKSMAVNFMLSNNSLMLGNKRTSDDWAQYSPTIVKNLGEFFYINKSKLKDIPIVALNEIKGFYVNSKYGKYARFNAMAILKDYVAGYGIFYDFRNRVNPNSTKHIAYGNWTYSSKQYKVKNISEFVTYYEIEEIENPYKTGSAISNDGAVIPCMGFYIELQTHSGGWFNITKSYQYPFYIK